MGLGIETDALAGASVVRRHARPGYTIIEVPERRDFWYGNALVLDAEPDVAAQSDWVDRHATYFAGTGVQRHVLVWEVVGERTGVPSVATGVQAELSRSIVFTRTTPFGAETGTRDVRELHTESDLAGVSALLAIDADAELGRPQTDFQRWQGARQDDDVRAGRLRLWGSFDRGELPAFAGVYASARLTRFATPVTHPSKRRRGHFRALCAVAVAAAFAAFPATTVVICAAAGEAPERIYRRLGFAAVGEQYGLVAELRT